ncbi:MAG: BglG family transcription antiterminator [Anaerorhabdus sp.]
MNKRQERIILFLENSQSWITGKELGKLLGVSDRTIRTDMNSINKEHLNLVESNVHYGYRLNRDIFTEKKLSSGRPIPQLPTERNAYILQELLSRRNAINLTFLQEELFVSEYTIDNDVKKINAMLKSYKTIKIEKKNNCITLDGSEEEKRMLYKKLLSAETNGNFVNMNMIAQLYTGFDILEIKDILESIFNEYDFSIREDAFPMLMIHIGISIERMRGEHYVVGSYYNEKLAQSKEYLIAKEFFNKISKKFLININNEEVALIALILLGKRSVDYTEVSLNKISKVELSDIIDIVLKRVKAYYDLDFLNDRLFIEGFKLHISNMIDRLQSNTPVMNVYLFEIKKKYPLVFDMAIFVSRVVEEQIGLKIEENEIGFIALHLGVAYDRLNHPGKYRVVLIHPSNQALKSICSQKIADRFSERIILNDKLNYFEESIVMDYEPDLILSTVPLKHNLPILTINIGLFVNADDEFKIFQALNNLDKKEFKKRFEETVQEFISEEFYFTDVDCATERQAIEFICDKLIENGIVSEKYKESVLEREQIASTSFNYGFAVPHSLNVPANKTVIAIAQLKQQIKWDQFPVRLVILLAIDEFGQKKLETFFEWLSGITGEPAKLLELLEAKSCDEFIKRMLS